jgi:hypothetical protein
MFFLSADFILFTAMARTSYYYLQENYVQQNKTCMKSKLRNLCLLLSAGLISVFTLQAQAQNKAVAGIKGGFNFSNLYVNDVNDENARVGFHAGVYGQLFASDAFAIQPEVNYSTKGTRVVRTFSIIDQETKFNLNYIDIPVLAVFKLGRAAEIHAGPYWSYLLGANIDQTGDLSNDFTTVDRKNFDNWDYGLVGGIGFNMGGIQLGARYNYGLNEIAKSSGAKSFLGNSKNQVAQLYLAFRLSGEVTTNDY